MKKYFVNKNAQATGEHEVHQIDCIWIKYHNNYYDLGYHNNCKEALITARKYYKEVDGCKTCCPECHRR